MKIENRKSVTAAVLLGMVLTFGLVNGLPTIMESWLSRTDNYRDICVHETYAIITFQPYRDVVILDVRSPEEFDNGHITGAINIEWTTLESNLSDLAHCPLAGHENDEIIVYCLTGGRSANASEVLATHGFQMVYNMVGGIEAWTYAAWNYPLVTETPVSYTDISVHEAYNMIVDDVSYPDLVILDVRSPDEYSVEHIENAINIPYYGDSDFGTRIGSLAGHENDEVVVYCLSAACSKGPSASQYLVNHGFTEVYHMYGGIQAWINAGYPVVHPEGLVLNPSVEEGDVWPYHWTRSKYADVIGEHHWSSFGYTGSRSLELRIQPSPGAPQWHSIYWYQLHDLDDPTSPFQRGSTYRCRAWFQTKDLELRLYVGFWDDSGWIAHASTGLAGLTSPEPTWSLSDWISFTVPPNAERIAIGMGVKLIDMDTGVSEALGRADDFEVQEVG